MLSWVYQEGYFSLLNSLEAAGWTRRVPISWIGYDLQDSEEGREGVSFIPRFPTAEPLSLSLWIHAHFLDKKNREALSVYLVLKQINPPCYSSVHANFQQAQPKPQPSISHSPP